MTGRIHSTESMGTVDGPGVRFVVFFQGCPMRCLYCHNPDTWTTDNGTEMTTQEILDKCKRYEPYMKNGGITLTGGEPLLQMDFALELLEGAKKNGIHTCLDTSGATFPGEAVSKEQLEQYYYLTKVADLVMLDIKHIDTVEHKRLTGRGNEHILEFARFLDRENVPMWIRHVVVPGITYDPRWLNQLGVFVGSLRNVKAIDVLPYHDMGKIKYEKLGVPYPLSDTLPLERDALLKAREYVLDGVRQARQ